MLQIAPYPRKAAISNIMAIEQTVEIVIEPLVEISMNTSDHGMIAARTSCPIEGISNATAFVRSAPSMAIAANCRTLGDRSHH
ncbi:hypothetical protein D3C75_976440 [compost metagenome]